MVLFQVVVGFLFLISGRRLFWLFVGCLGAVTGMLVMEPFIGNVDWPVIVLVIAMAGVCGAVLAIVFQKGAVGLSGFLAGGYLAVAFPVHWEPRCLMDCGLFT